MFSPLKEAAYFARHHARPLLVIAVVLSLPAWLVEYSLPQPDPEQGPNLQFLLSGILITALGVLQYAAAIIYIHQQVQQQPISAFQSIMLASQRFFPLFVLNLMMALVVGAGFLLLVVPGVFLAYKLMFGEFFLLFHGHKPLQALKSSYRHNSALGSRLLPPLLVWIALMVFAAIFNHRLQPEGSTDWSLQVLFELVYLGLNLFGWALLYRLYQRYLSMEEPLKPLLSAPAQPAQVIDQSSDKHPVDDADEPSDGNSNSDPNGPSDDEPPHSPPPNKQE
ncbi:YciC family protein [Motiliproteus sp.]|uniref:YciC family protein n=1 Tax=Motiliproteus sp. TaxID=1898955 RepID=UPI003BAC6BCD